MTKNLLFLSHCLPWPLDKGEKIRAWHCLQHLAMTHAVHLGCVADPPDLAHVPRFADMCASIGAFPIDRRFQKLRALLHARPGRPLMPDFYTVPALQRWVRALLAEIPVDLIYIYTAAMAPYALDIDGIPKILDAVDIDSEKWAGYARTARLPMRAVWAREGRNLLAYERRAAAICSTTLFVSEPEALHFIELAPETAARIGWVENGVDLEYFSPAHGFPNPYPGPGPVFVFTGNMDYRPNADAVAWFAGAVMPGLCAGVPGAQFWIVGANPTPGVQALAALPGIHVSGRVPDTRPYVAHAAACVCPLQIARGIQNKVLEGMAMGRPVIASPQAYQGVRATPGRDLLVAVGAEGFIASALNVVEGRHAGMGDRARAAMQANYAWPEVLARLNRHLRSPVAVLN